MHEHDLHELMQDETAFTAEELATGGFSVIDRTDGGMVAHRGVLHPDEYVDRAVLREAAEASLGFTYAEITAAYKMGRPTDEQRQQREKIDARLLALSRSGGAMSTLAVVLDLGPATIDRALARARRAEVAPIVKSPAVVTRLVCFTCEADTARPRRRRHSTSPEQWVGTVNLCDKCYTRGFDTRPGNPRYWEHRLATRPIGV